jgi:hypothetical protein
MTAYSLQDAHQDDLDIAAHNAYLDSIRIEQELIETGVSGDIDLEEALSDLFPKNYAFFIAEMWKSGKQDAKFSLAAFTELFMEKIDAEIQTVIAKNQKEVA